MKKKFNSDNTGIFPQLTLFSILDVFRKNRDIKKKFPLGDTAIFSLIP